MGCWATPRTEDAMEEVERVMARPLSARIASEILHNVAGDDLLHEMLDAAARRDPKGDVRPLVAMMLDQWANWTPPDEMGPAWGIGLRERAKRIAQGFRDSPVDGLLDTALPDTPEAAVERVARVLDVRGEYGNRFLVTRAGAPGTYAVLDCILDGLFRVDVVYGLVYPTEPLLDRGLKLELFGVVSGTRH